MEENVYFWCALVGCSLLVIQVVLQVIGLGSDTDLDHAGADADAHVGGDFHGDVHGDAMDSAHGTAGNIFFGVLSLKAMVSFAGIFGLSGLSLLKTDLPAFHRVSLSILAGLVAMVLVAYMMRALHHLTSSGSVVLANAVGRRAIVYLRIPERSDGRGKITIELQERSVELNAITDGEAIAAGKVVKVLEVLPNETVKVEAV